MNFYIGDKVLIGDNLISGCYEAKDKIGIITEEKNNHGLIEDGINVKIKNSYEIWKVNIDSLILIKRKSFNKDDLKDGMVVEFRNNKRGMIISNKIIMLNNNLTFNLDSFSYDLWIKDHFILDYRYVIVKIYDDRENGIDLENMIKSPINCIWSRN